MRIIHFSDPHVIRWQKAKARQFLGKRATGWANFRFKRCAQHPERVLEALLDDIRAQSPDHVIVTGDVSSLAFRDELRAFDDLLQARGFGGDDVSIVPGNHDAYTRMSARDGRFVADLGHYATSDLHGGRPGYPFVRIRGPVAVMGLSSAVHRPTFFANGALGRAQVEAVESLLGHDAVRARLPVLALHHPLVAHPHWMKEVQGGLLDVGRIMEALGRGLAGRDALVLCGHWHRRARVELDLPGKVELFQAPSASRSAPDRARMAAYFMIDLEPSQGGASITGVTVRGFDPTQNQVCSFE